MYYSIGMNESTTILTEKEMADLIKVSRTTLQRWRKEGMPHIKLEGIRGSVRYDYGDVVAWMKKGGGDE